MLLFYYIFRSFRAAWLLYQGLDIWSGFICSRTASSAASSSIKASSGRPFPPEETKLEIPTEKINYVKLFITFLNIIIKLLLLFLFIIYVFSMIPLSCLEQEASALHLGTYGPLNSSIQPLFKSFAKNNR